MVNHQASICLGSDSNVRISFAEEMRLLEFGQRLLGQRRGVCVDERGRVAEQLYKSATIHGARALNQRVGSMRPGCCADFFTIDLNHPNIDGWTDDTLLASFVFGTSNEAIAEVCVNGRWRDAGRA
jgi:formimidoylglutamate deiminase